MKNVYTRCCGYNESLAVDTTGLVQVAFYSNADPDGATAYESLGADLSPPAPTPLKPRRPARGAARRRPLGQHLPRLGAGISERDRRLGRAVPRRVAGGRRRDFRGPFDGGDPHMALSVDGQDRLWAVWTQAGVLHAARSRSHGMHFGATVSVPLPGTVYQISALGLAASPGTVDVVVNTGTSLVEQALRARALGPRLQEDEEGRQEDGRHLVGPGARRRLRRAGRDVLGSRRHVQGNASGTAQLTGAGFKRGSAKAAAPGYVGASFRVP